jgi:hypothetical protein
VKDLRQGGLRGIGAIYKINYCNNKTKIDYFSTTYFLGSLTIKRIFLGGKLE